MPLRFTPERRDEGTSRWGDVRLNDARAEVSGASGEAARVGEEKGLRRPLTEADAEYWGNYLETAPFDMLQVARGTPEEAEAANQQVLRFLDVRVPPGDGRRAPAIDQKTAARIYSWVMGHPVQQRTSTYDPTGRFGFCFGRATHVHLKALHEGVEKDKIRKVWLVGSFKTSDGGTWGHHVATMIQAEEGGWWVIDKLVNRPMRHDEWYRAMKQRLLQGEDKSLNLFVTPAERFAPFSPDTYSPASSKRTGTLTGYNGYFRDMMRHLQRDALRKVELRDEKAAREALRHEARQDEARQAEAPALRPTPAEYP